MVQDIYPHIFKNEFSHKPVEEGDTVLCYRGNTLLMDAADGIRLPAPESPIYALTSDGRRFRLITLPSATIAISLTQL